MAVQTYKVGDLVRWDYQQFDEEGTCHDGAAHGLILEVKDSVSSESGKCYRVVFQEVNIRGTTEQYDYWLYGCEIINLKKMNK